MVSEGEGFHQIHRQEILIEVQLECVQRQD